MKTSYIYISIISFVIGALCHWQYYRIGQYIAEDGTLVEPFALIPMGYLFYLIGIIFFIFYFIKRLIDFMRHKSRF